MEGYTLYEEIGRGGAVPETVLAIPNSELEKQQRQPGYQPVPVIIRNPNRIEQERQEHEAWALRNAEMHDYRLGGLLDSTAPVSHQQAIAEASIAPALYIGTGTTQERQPQTQISKHSSPVRDQVGAQYTSRQTPPTPNDRPGIAPSIPTTSVAPPFMPILQHRPAASSPLRSEIRGQPTPSQQPTLPSVPMGAPERARLQRLALSAIGYLESEKLHHPITAPPRDPYPTDTQPMSEVVWRLVTDIKKLPTNIRTGFPMRSELRRDYFKNHFHPGTGVLRQDSPLWRYAGNTTMFTPPVWQYLMEVERRVSVYGSSSAV